jgi:hypothetical protein
MKNKILTFKLLFLVLLLIFVSSCTITSECQTDDDCDTNEQGDCDNIPYGSGTFVADHPGCACEENGCVEAYCELPCELG